MGEHKAADQGAGTAPGPESELPNPATEGTGHHGAAKSGIPMPDKSDVRRRDTDDGTAAGDGGMPVGGDLNDEVAGGDPMGSS